MSTITLTSKSIDILEQILAVPDPKPAEQWLWRKSGSGYEDPQPLKSIGELRDLISALPLKSFLIVAHHSQPGLFTQCARTGDRFRTECSVPTGDGNDVHTFADDDGLLSMALCQTVMGAYVQSNGRLPHLGGHETEVMHF